MRYKNKLDRASLEERETLLRPRVRVRREERQSNKKGRRSVLIGGLVFFLGSLALSVVGSLIVDPRYRGDLALAQTGMQELRGAAVFLELLSRNPFDAQAVSQARQVFSSASRMFTQLDADVRSVPAVAALLPLYGTRLGAALHLVPLAVALSQAGVLGCDMLNVVLTRLREDALHQASTGQGITLSDLAMVADDVQGMRSAFATAVEEAGQLRPGDVQFDPRIGTLLDTFQKDAPMISGWLNAIEKVLPVAGALLGIGTPTNYLLELLDSTELRPGGGFIGNYGIATLFGGRLTAARVSDVDLLDRPSASAGYTIPYPAAYTWFDIAPSSWSLRDSNLDADFPTAARYAELLYRQEGGKVPVEGVIAITPALIQQALTLTGPIAVPEYSETVTAQNLIARIHYHELGDVAAGAGSNFLPVPGGHSSLRKRFTELLGEHFLARIRELTATESAKFFQVLMEGVRTKDLQVYFNDESAEALLQRAGLDGSIQAAPGDGVFVVDANIGVTKANSFITNTLTDTVTLDTEGNALHHLLLRYAWTTPGQVYGHLLYRDYVRVYVPVGSVLQTQDGWQFRGASEDFHSEVWAGFFTLVYGQARTITLSWSVPRAVTPVGHGWQYQELIQRQAGAFWTVHVRVGLPTCGVLTSESGGVISAGKQAVMLNRALLEDVHMGVEYECE